MISENDFSLVCKINSVHRNHKKKNEKCISRRMLLEDCTMDIVKVIHGNAGDIPSMKNVSCHLEKSKILRKGCYLMVRGSFENLTKHTFIFNCQSSVAATASTILQVTQRLKFNPQKKRVEVMRDNTGVSLRDYAEEHLADIPSELKNQDVIAVANFLYDSGLSDSDYDRGYEVNTYFRRRAKLRGYEDTVALLKSNPMVLGDMHGETALKQSEIRKICENLNIKLPPEITLLSKISNYINMRIAKGDSFVPVATLAGIFRHDLEAIQCNDFTKKFHWICHIKDKKVKKSTTSDMQFSSKNNPIGQREAMEKYYLDAFLDFGLDRTDAERKANNSLSGVYLSRVFFSEYYAAKNLAEMVGKDDDMKACFDATEFKGLDAQQKKAIEMAYENRVSVIIGSAGTGKTLTVQRLVQSLEKKGIHSLILAPSAKAAANAAERLDAPYSTIDRFIKTNALDDDLGVSSGLPINTGDSPEVKKLQFLIIDEMSMCSVVTFAKLLDYIKNNASVHLVLVGDPAQLPAIGPRFFFQISDGLLGADVPVTKLKKIFRSDDSLIRFADGIRRGKLRKRVDGVEISDTTIESYIMNHTEDIRAKKPLFLAETRKGSRGTDVLNHLLRNILNPTGTPIPDTQFYVGDTVITSQNDYLADDDGGEKKEQTPHENRDFDIYNGTMGKILRCVSEADQLYEVELYMPHKTRTCLYDINDLMIYLQPAYAITVHKAQGSEADEVVFVKGENSKCTRNLLYTAVTRARKHVTLIGSDFEETVARLEQPNLSKFAFRFLEQRQQDMADDKIDEIGSEQIVEDGLSLHF